MKSARLLAVMIAGPLAGSCAGPLGWNPRPLCQDPDVLAFVSDHYRATDSTIQIAPDATTQYPRSPDGTVLCAVYVRRVVYDSASFGGFPKIVFEPRFFQVKTLQQGFEVNFTPSGQGGMRLSD